MTPELNVLALYKGKERYIFVYDDVSRETLLSALRDAAADPNCSVNWFDAAVLTERAREQWLNDTADKSGVEGIL